MAEHHDGSFYGREGYTITELYELHVVDVATS